MRSNRVASLPADGSFQRLKNDRIAISADTASTAAAVVGSNVSHFQHALRTARVYVRKEGRKRATVTPTL